MAGISRGTGLPGRVSTTARRVRPAVGIEALERRALLSADLVADINPGTLGSDLAGDNLAPVGLQRAGGRVYYQANDGIHGDELWTSDGTAAGTRIVADVSP